jgi:thiol:disulfide interchange protein DsbA
MKRMIRLLPVLLGWAVLAQGAAPVEGRDYQTINPAQPTSDPSRIVVTEFFSYYCPHCASFARPFEAWKRTLPADVRVERVPATLGHPQWVPVQRAYLALAAMGVIDKVDDAIFQAIHQQGVRMDSEESIAAWLTTRGVDARKFSTMYRSFGIDSQQRTAENRTRILRLPGVPTLVIDGRYMMSILDNGNFRAQLAVAEELIKRQRQQRAATAPARPAGK